METMQHHRSMEAFCRQRAKMEGENELFWLTEAEISAKLVTNAYRRQLLEVEKKSQPVQSA
jgi:hypothetical protein